MEAVYADSLPALYRALAATGLVRRLLELARDEDLGPPGAGGDLTTMAALDPERRAAARLVARDGGVVAGLAAMPDLIKVFGAAVELQERVNDGDRVEGGATLAVLSGPVGQILTIERTALNLVGRLSGIATTTARFVAAIPTGSRAAIYDTRKTTPGLRVLEKYAVRCGGGRSHRLGLHDAVLIKDNHIAAVPPDQLAKVIATAAARARATRPDLAFVEVEVDSLQQLAEVLKLPRGTVNIVLLDNMSPAMIRRAVELRDASESRPELEASGGVRLETVAEIARAGVDRISAGALTHSVSSLDVALDMDPRAA